MEFEKTITLQKPVKVGDVEFTELKLREPTAGELERAASATNNVGGVIELIVQIAKIPRPAVEAIRQSDFKAADAFFAQFGG